MISAHVHNLSVDGNVLTAILAPSILEGAKEKMYSTWFLLYNEFESGSKFVVAEEHFLDDASLRINMSVQRVRKRYVLVYSQEMCSCLHHKIGSDFPSNSQPTKKPDGFLPFLETFKKEGARMAVRTSPSTERSCT